MAALTDEELLTKIKNGLGIAGTYQDETIQVYIDEVKAFMSGAGVPAAVVSDSAAVGCILRGVVDLWNYGSGSVGLSDYFKMRVTQFALLGADDNA